MPDDGGDPPHPQQVGVRRLPVDDGVIDVVGPDGVEGADVARLAGHEAGEQRGDPEADQPARDSSGRSAAAGRSRS